MNFLRLTYAPEDEWHGEVTAYIQCNGFTGRGSAWFGRSQIDDFLAQLEPCPISDSDAPVLSGGYFNRDGSLAEELIGIRIRPHNSTGTLRVSVHLADQVEHEGEKQQLNAVLLTTYAEVAVFKSALAAHLAGTTGEAELRGGI
jgi:hypothetical protein